MAGSYFQDATALAQQCSDHVDPDGLFELEDQPGPDRLDNCRCAALLALHRIGQVRVLGRAHLGDRSATRDVGHAIDQQLTAYDENAWGCCDPRSVCAD